MEYDGNVGGGVNSSWDNVANSSPDKSGANSGESRRKATDEQTLIPVTIRMIINATGTILSDGREPHQIKLVGAVREVTNQSTSNVYSIEDGTGMIEVKEWVDANHDNNTITKIREEASQENIYVRIIGKISDYDGKKQVVAYSVRKVSTGNELTHHLLEVVHSGERFKKRNQIVGAPNMNRAAIGNGYNERITTTPVRQIGGNDASMGDELESRILTFIRSHTDDGGQGCDVNDYIKKYGGGTPEANIRQKFMFLASEGLIYSTTDEDHFAAV